MATLLALPADSISLPEWMNVPDIEVTGNAIGLLKLA
jgi:hypothetical protein